MRAAEGHGGRGVGVELVVVAVAGGLLGTAAAFFTAMSFGARRRYRAVESAWQKFATSKGLRFIRATGWAGKDKGRPPAIDGEVQGVAVDITLQITERGPMTRVEATLPSVADDFLFAIYRRTSLTKLSSEFSDVTETLTGNKVFDASFALLSNESDLARSILNRRLAQVVGEFPRKFSYLYSSQTRFTLIWPGMEADPAVLDAAINVVFTACRRRA